jgi:hypothetical protein
MPSSRQGRRRLVTSAVDDQVSDDAGQAKPCMASAAGAGPPNAHRPEADVWDRWPQRRHTSSGISESSGVRPPVHTCRPVAGSAEARVANGMMIVGMKATEVAVAAGAATLVARRPG